jgi:hypothetical protein
VSNSWATLDYLQKCANVVREHVENLKIPPEEMK